MKRAKNQSHFLKILQVRQEKGLPPNSFIHSALENWPRNSHSLDLKAHFGCVNALSFSKNGQILASGGDDKRILLWNVCKAIQVQDKSASEALATKHSSNIFCLDFDCQDEMVFSGGNDEIIIIHDLSTGKLKDVFNFTDPINCVNGHPELSNLLASAGADGKVLQLDLRMSNSDSIVIKESHFGYHGVQYNPIDPRYVITANLREGVSLIDLRKPNQPILTYGRNGENQSSMCAQFSPDGTRIFTLGRQTNPMIYNLGNPVPLVEFDHPGYFNNCTIKSGTFCYSDYVFSGSDDFNVYGWKIPNIDEVESTQKPLCIRRADLVLQGHLSIVNQVRFCENVNVLATSGVEKKIKFWSPFNISNKVDRAFSQPDAGMRKLHKRMDYFRLILASTELSDDPDGSESVEENMKMIAFFDTLVQREISSDSDDDVPELLSSDDGEPDNVDALMAKKRKAVKRRRKKGRKTCSEYVISVLEAAKKALIETEVKLPLELAKSPPIKVNEEIRKDILSSLNNEFDVIDEPTVSDTDEENGDSYRSASLFKNGGGGSKSQHRNYRKQK